MDSQMTVSIWNCDVGGNTSTVFDSLTIVKEACSIFNQANNNISKLKAHATQLPPLTHNTCHRLELIECISVYITPIR